MTIGKVLLPSFQIQTTLFSLSLLSCKIQSPSPGNFLSKLLIPIPYEASTTSTFALLHSHYKAELYKSLFYCFVCISCIKPSVLLGKLSSTYHGAYHFLATERMLEE